MSQRNTHVPERADEQEACTLLEVISRVSGKWSIVVLLETARRPMRFTELERAIHGISRRMLTLTLRQLERDGFLVRTVHPTVPPRVEYAATDMARELHAHLSGLTEWAERHRGTVAAARAAFDEAAAAR
ncbi:helix-turn-helix domain-containing protein [Streptomyces sp. MP131-18]|uniref:winged helix-turn-helix transcriptional regulator n=1 Tax=Streptomyces sp. MP131-18 TaxID=1857892 RepID=UPI00097C7BC0|nr:helix-turn-helix domain-containing protein [Streptomyces sp. MP131-18]ONK11908.1 putative HTH-type transcriptional regulator YybR [Streptomyces sp. MP131-18]